MEILLLESFYTSSHKAWVDGLVSNSLHHVVPLTLPGRHWKWRMHHAGSYFASQISKIDKKYDLIICSDLMNVAEFRGLLQSFGTSNSWFNKTPILLYFHENQITYPWSESDPDVVLKRDNHYGWINYISSISADHIVFNSKFHQASFLDHLNPFLNQFPDCNGSENIDLLSKKSSVLPIGMELDHLVQAEREESSTPNILWNHRWEYDKNPDLFFKTLYKLQDENLEFNIIVAGESYSKFPKVFKEAKQKLSGKIIHFGYAKNKAEYKSLLLKSNIVPVTSNQDFFGISAIEAIAAGCMPLLPNRLAFPEHLEGSEFEKFYFNSEDEFISKLREFIINYDEANNSTRTQVMKYDWGILAEEYDALFERFS